ncbi:MAG TPA: hypothetical protein ENO24_05445 [Chloroflexi bacterium]|nr:hypothetical protein [Chloroflexota bacterium]
MTIRRLLGFSLLLAFLLLACTDSGDDAWTVDAPPGRTHGLFTEGCLTDESCWDCGIADLPAGTKLEPGPRGCQQTEWDPSYVYCHVQVVSGDYEGEWGWVNQKFINK